MWYIIFAIMGFMVLKNIIKDIKDYKKEDYIRDESCNESWYFFSDHWWW
jgi:hypothetical protein